MNDKEDGGWVLFKYKAPPAPGIYEVYESYDIEKENLSNVNVMYRLAFYNGHWIHGGLQYQESYRYHNYPTTHGDVKLTQAHRFAWRDRVCGLDIHGRHPELSDEALGIHIPGDSYQPLLI